MTQIEIKNDCSKEYAKNIYKKILKKRNMCNVQKYAAKNKNMQTRFFIATTI